MARPLILGRLTEEAAATILLGDLDDVLVLHVGKLKELLMPEEGQTVDWPAVERRFVELRRCCLDGAAARELWR
jgi:hypothetical protein